MAGASKKKGIKEALINAKRVLKAECAALEGLTHIPEMQLKRVITLLSKRKGKIIVMGIGKSGFIGMKIAATFTSLGHRAVFLHPVEALHGDIGIVEDGDVLIAISFSGASQEVVRIVKYLTKSFKNPTIAITGGHNSPLAKVSDTTLSLSVKKEGSPHDLAPMASTTATLAVGDMLAAALTAFNGFEKHYFAKFHPGGSLGLELLKVKDAMRAGKELPVVKEKDSLQKALAAMTNGKFGVVGVIGKTGTIIGVITDGDIRRFFLKHNEMKGKYAKDAMIKNPKTTPAGNSLKRALQKMEQHKVTNLFVVDSKEHPVGIIRMHDIVEVAML